MMNTEMTHTIPKLVEQGYTITHLVNPQILAKEKIQEAKIGARQYGELCDFLGWPNPARVY